MNGSATLTHDGPPGAVIVEAAIANFTVTPSIIQPVKFEARPALHDQLRLLNTVGIYQQHIL